MSKAMIILKGIKTDIFFSKKKKRCVNVLIHAKNRIWEIFVFLISFNKKKNQEEI